MELFTSCCQNPDLARLDVIPVGISRSVPRGTMAKRLPYRYKRLSNLAPLGDLFEHWIAGTIDPDGYRPYTAPLSSVRAASRRRAMDRAAPLYGSSTRLRGPRGLRGWYPSLVGKGEVRKLGLATRADVRRLPAGPARGPGRPGGAGRPRGAV